jgi:hypothetical protein
MLVAVFAWTGYLAYEAVEDLTVITTGVVVAGNSVEDAFESAAGVVDDLPLVGPSLADALRTSGSSTGGELAVLGGAGEERILSLARVLGLIVFGLPTLTLLLFAMPGRVRQVRELSAASALLKEPDDPERQKLLAMRAVFSLPYGTLLQYSQDPLGDLAAGRHDALAAAALAEAGLEPSPR